MAEKEWIEIGRVVGDTGPKGDTGDIGIGTVIKGHYTTYEEFVSVHPTGEVGDAYIVDSSYYYWDGTGWANAGSIKGEKGDTGGKTAILVLGHLFRLKLASGLSNINVKDRIALTSTGAIKSDDGEYIAMHSVASSDDYNYIEVFRPYDIGDA